MTVYISRDASDAELTHYGVKGMKWRKHLRAGLDQAGNMLNQMGQYAQQYFNVKGATPTGYNAPSQANQYSKQQISSAKSKGKARLDYVFKSGVDNAVMRGLGKGKKGKVVRKSNGKIDHIVSNPSKKERKAVEKWNKGTLKRMKKDKGYGKYMDSLV